MDERENREACIRGTVERSPKARELTKAEINHAVEVAVELSDGRGNRTWGELAEAGFASVRVRRNK
jgi:hypothetical protein